MDDERLKERIDLWSAVYRASYDSQLVPLGGKGTFSGDELELLYRWKFRLTRKAAARQRAAATRLRAAMR